MAHPPTNSMKHEKLGIMNKEIVEIKKKVQLSEGHRKANFEECDATKRKNAERIIRLKKKLQKLQTELARAKNNEEITERASKISQEPIKCTKRQGLDEAIDTVNEDNVRLRKKLDLVRYRVAKQKNKLATLLLEYKQLMGTGTRKIVRKKRKMPGKKDIISLENQLHRVSVMQMEADMVRKKYRCVRSGLKADSAFYASWLQDLADSIKEQENEIHRLQKVKEEAFKLKESTTETLNKEGMEAAKTDQEREITIQQYRKRVEDRKLELEYLERSLLPINRHLLLNDTDTDEPKIDSKMNPKNQVAKLEAIFFKLRDATGVSKTEDVLERFSSQQATKEKLKKMQISTEKTKLILEKKIQQLTAEIEMKKFSESKDADQRAEQFERINEDITNHTNRENKAVMKKQEIENLLEKVNDTIWNIYIECQEASDFFKLQNDVKRTDSIEILKSLVKTLEWILDTTEKDYHFDADFDDLIVKKLGIMSMENTLNEERSKNMDECPLFPMFPSTTVTPGGGVQQLSEDEEEISSRNALKRQAQILVDAKSRRKGFNFKR